MTFAPLRLLLACCSVVVLVIPPASSRTGCHGGGGVGAYVGSVSSTTRRNPPGRSKSSSSSTSILTSTSTSLRMALGGNYLEDIARRGGNNGDDGDRGDDDDDRDGGGGGRWGFFGSRAKGGGGGGARTAARPSSPPDAQPSSPASGRNNNNNYGIGGGKNNGGGVVPRVVSIRQPQDLLDFVIQDERLSVVKVYASWCKTCQVFDARYRKLASQLGDVHDESRDGELVSEGAVRFAEMQYDDPNNEEMCRLLNATKLPYILMYKGSRGKVSDFQCGPAKFQLLIDEVAKHADGVAVVADVDGASSSSSLGGEQEWSVVREQQRKRNQQLRLEQREAQYGGAGSIINYQAPSSADKDRLRRKEEEITRLYSELSNLRKDFDRGIVRLKDEHKEETNKLNELIRIQTKEYEDERRALSAQIKDLSREMMDREKAIRSSESAAGQRLRDEMKQREEEYAAKISGLNSRIAELERELFKSANELRYNSDANANDRREITGHVAALEQRIAELEKELIEEKRVVVASTEEASRVLKQLERIKSSEDDERKVLAARIVELEGDISRLEEQMRNAANSNTDLAMETQRELEKVRRERDEERDLLKTRIADLEQELEWQARTSSMSDDSSSREMQTRQEELRQESERLASRILELENEIDERDRLLRTSNKATDILLDTMEAQKRDYEKELDRTASLVNELEEAIVSREEEMGMLQERSDALERLVEELKRREGEMESAAAKANAFQFADAMRMAERGAKPPQQEQEGGIGSSSFGMERARMEAEGRRARMEAEDREEELARRQEQQWRGQGPNPRSFGSSFGGAKDQTSSGWASVEESMESYERLKDVLMPDEISPRREPGMPRSGAGRVDNIREAPGVGRGDKIREGAGLSSLMTPNNNSGTGRYDNIREGAGSASFGVNTPSPAVVNAAAELPTPALAFERRLAENPIVPAGAFGGSKPTSSFFSRSPKSSGSASAPSDTPDYYQNVISNFNNEAPAMPPVASFGQRPTAPAPRGSVTTGKTENIYAGAGSASTPRPSTNRQEEPIAPVPTPAMAFERRLAENPIVPSGAFGGSQPTARFFSPPVSSTAGSGQNSSPQSSYPPEDDSQAKWQSLDDFEKKRVAAEAYKAFEKSLEDSRRNTQTKPKGGTMGMGVGARTGGGGGGSDRASKRPATAEAKNLSQMELERKKHQDMVRTAAAQEKGQAAAPTPTAISPKTVVPSRQLLSAQQIQASATQASAKRMSLAERAAKADQDRRDREKRIKAEARKSQEAKRIEPLEKVQNAMKADEVKRREEIMRADELKRKAEADLAAAAEAKARDVERVDDAKRKEEIKRADELKRNAEANLAAAADAKAKAEAEAAKQSLERERRFANMKESDKVAATAAVRARPEEVRVELESSHAKERIEAALLGAIESDDSAVTTREGQVDGQSESEVKRKTIDRRAERAKSLLKKTRVAGGFAVSKYDVVVMKDSKNDINMPHLLEGSLKDLLKDGLPPKRRRSSGDQNY